MTCEPEASSPGSAGSTSPSTPRSESNPPGSAKPTPQPDACSSGDSPASQSSRTSETPEPLRLLPTPRSHEGSNRRTKPTPGMLRGEAGLDLPAAVALMSSTADTPANRSPSPGSDKARTTPGISGPSSRDSFAYYDPPSSCWRTSQGTLLSDSEASSVAWPRWGMTRAGDAFELPTPAPLTGGSGYSWLLPTPNSYESTPTDEYVEEMREAGIQPDERLYLPGRKWHAQRTLSRIAPALFQTPSAADAAGGHLTRGGKRSNELLLKGQVKALLPTPGANDMTGGEGSTREARQEHGTGGPALRDIGHLLPTPTARDDRGPNTNAREGGPDLPSAARLLPTPTSQAAKHGETPDVTANGHGYNLWDLPTLLSPGEPTSLPFDGGSTSPEPPHPGQLMIGDA